MNKETAVRNVLTSNKFTDLKRLGTLAYKFKGKCEKHPKKITEVERNVRTGLFL